MFLLFGFSIQEFFICYFYCQKTAFVCEFQHTPLWKLILFSRFYTLCGHEICVFWPPKTAVPLRQGQKKLFLQL
jgi:hypothetical protein